MIKKIALLLLIPFIMVFSQTGEEKVTNPFFMEWTTPYQTPPFNLIKIEHYMPAYLEGIKQHEAEIKLIIESKDEPTFENTIVALDNSGEVYSAILIAPIQAKRCRRFLKNFHLSCQNIMTILILILFCSKKLKHYTISVKRLD